MELTVLGKSPSWTDSGGACTGYLVRAGGYSLLLDCGSGVFARLREHLDYVDLDAIVISHMHADHVLDLVPFAMALTHSPRCGGARGESRPRPDLHLPPGGLERIRRLTADLFGQETLLERAFDTAEYLPDSSLVLGPLTARFCEVPHFIRTFAVELSEGERRLTYGADCGPNDALTAFASRTELLIVEATQPPDEPAEPGGFRGHMTAREAGRLGRAAGAGRLLITHFSDELDPHTLRAEAAAGFGGEVELASSGLTVVL